MAKKILAFLFGLSLTLVAWAGLEDLTGSSKYISDFVVTNPTATDSKSEGDDHIRGIKNAIKNTFPNITGPVTATQTELNYTDITTLGTAQASKALTADASGNTTGAKLVNPTLSNATISSGIINNTGIGGTTPSTGSFTSIYLSANIVSTKACSAGFRQLNYCLYTPTTPISLTRDSCTGYQFSADATYADFLVAAVARSNNGTGVRSTTVTFYSDVSCSTVLEGYTMTAAGYEFSAITADTTIGANSVTFIHVPLVLSGGNTNVYMKMTDDSGNHGVATIEALGYYDQ